MRTAPNNMEIAYLLIEESQLDLDGFAGDVESLPMRTWLPIDFARNDKSLLDNNCSQGCTSCQLNWTFEKPRNGHDNDKGKNRSNMDLSSIISFSGKASDVICHECQEARSDMYLLLGLVKACQDHVTIERAEMLLHCSELDKKNPRLSASLVVTLSFPYLQQGTPGSRFLLAVNAPKFNKPLSPALQLLLSLVQNDWTQLDGAMERLQQNDKTTLEHRRDNPPLFPSKMTFSELYRRIPGSNECDLASMKRLYKAKLSTSLLIALPKEILVDSLAPFLRAKSLHSLRNTCTSMRDTLRAVVPGLKLRLYQHQVASLTWMRQRECKGLMERDCLDPTLPGDLHRSVTGGWTTLLRPRCIDNDCHSSITSCIRIDQRTGREVQDTELMKQLPRKVARGGLLCDDPGLGKTITLLSLILQTSGMSTMPAVAPMKEISIVDDEPRGLNNDDARIFETYYSDHVSTDFQRPMLRRLVLDLLRRLPASGREFVSECKRIMGRVDNNEYSTSFRLFEDNVRNIIKRFPIFDHHDDEREDCLSVFEALVYELKTSQLCSAKKSFANASARPNSRVTAIIEKQKLRELEEALLSTSATIIIVPSVLLNHWKTQIERHVDASYVVAPGRRPLTFVFHQHASKGEMTVEMALSKIDHDKTHSPFIFLDMATTRKLPSPAFLAKFQVVITSNMRCKNEWSNGSLRKELERNRNGSSSYHLDDEANEACPLLKIHWLRLVVDEGHSMAQQPNSNTIQFASWISAQRRWAMTGTPTKQTKSQFTQIKHLVTFLQHEFFSSRLDGERIWKSNIASSWNEESLASFFRLRNLLKVLTKRHTKLDIVELPSPLYHRKIVTMSPEEAAAYNSIACAVQTNLLVCGMGGSPMGLQDSLLHRSQRKSAKKALDNIRRSCIGFSRVMLKLEPAFFLETIELLEKHEICESRIHKIRQYMIGAQEEQIFPCECCGLRLAMLLLLPCCGGLACPECMDGCSECALCDAHFDVNDFQLLQPGFDFTWSTVVDEKKDIPQRKPSASEISIGTQPDTINLEPIVRPLLERRRTRKYGDHKCEFDIFAVDGRCVLCLHEHNACVLTNEKSRCATCYRVGIPCPPDESKAFYLTQKLRKLCSQRRQWCASGSSEFNLAIVGDHRPLKAIIFSQFREVLNVIGTRLIWEFGSACIAEFWGKSRQAELTKFASNSDCFCMLLGKDGSEGLDLSFVTHVFFLEEILDKSLMDQAVARAWRMGAMGRLEVETIIAKETVEETMENLDALMNEDKVGIGKSVARGESSDLKSDQLSKTHFLLRSLRLLTEYHYFAQTPDVTTTAKENKKLKVEESIHRKRPKYMLPIEDLEHRGCKRVRFNV
ncbi:hypothetical protein MPSEU_000956900 [Mayamaea pseudoterrestris]|nr:hypothetical protein MPSEU_000956900 [Mayamaea pseudoterrestris]